MLMFYKAKRIKQLERDNEALAAANRSLMKENKKLKEGQIKQIAEKITIGVELEGMEEAQKQLEKLAETAKATFAELEKLNEILEDVPAEEAEVQADG